MAAKKIDSGPNLEKNAVKRKIRASKKMGRPSDLSPTLYITIMNLAKTGMSSRQIAKIVGINQCTISLWTKENKNFAVDLERCRMNANQMVENAMFQAAIGFECDEEKVFCNKFGNIVSKTIRKQFPPDITAAKFWSVNRDPSRWSNKDLPSTTGNVVVTLAYDPTKRLIDNGTDDSAEASEGGEDGEAEESRTADSVQG